MSQAGQGRAGRSRAEQEKMRKYPIVWLRGSESNKCVCECVSGEGSSVLLCLSIESSR